MSYVQYISFYLPLFGGVGASDMIDIAPSKAFTADMALGVEPPTKRQNSSIYTNLNQRTDNVPHVTLLNCYLILVYCVGRKPKYLL